MLPGNLPSDAEVDELIADVEKYTLPNHIFWGLWGIISVCITSTFFFLFNFLYIFIRFCLKICSNFHFLFEQAHVTKIDFDYKEYARQRFRQYWLRKPELLKGKMVISHEDSKNEKENGAGSLVT